MAFSPTVGIGGNAILQPSSTKQLSGTNYIPRNYFADGVTQVGGTGTDSSTFLPDLMEKEVSRFGPEGLAGILDRLGGKIPFKNSEIKWAEKARLHTLYTNVYLANSTSSNVFTVRENGAAVGSAAINHILRVGQTVIVSQNTGGNVVEDKGVITAITGTTFTALSYTGTNWTASLRSASTATAADALTVRVYGSDFGKGTYGMSGSIEAQTEIYSVTPVIFKDHYKINGSDISQVGWVEGVDANGATSFMWYLKSKSDTMKRWNDYLEMGLIEGVGADAGSQAAGHSQRLGSQGPNTPAGSGVNNGPYVPGGGEDNNNRSTNVVGGQGVAGLFEQIETRGSEFDAFFSGTGPASTQTISQYERDVENIILALEQQASIANYTWFIDRQTSLNIDKWLATKNSYGAVNQGPNTSATPPATGGSATDGVGQFFGDGLSVTSSDKMYSFGFKGFDWGGYNFMKTDWNYLNDPTLRGHDASDLAGLMIPMGTTTVKDMMSGMGNVARPYVYIGYRVSEVDNRMNKEWITGSIGAYTDDEDAMKCHFLSERTLVVQAANNFVILKK